MQGLIGTGLATLFALSTGAESLHRGAIAYLNGAGMSWFVSPATVETASQAKVQAYLDRLKGAGIDPSQQGVWFQSGLNVLAQHQGTTPLSGASLTKLATSLAALETWDPNHTFVTEIWADGPIVQGTLQGNLIVRGGGDPMFVWEEAIALGNALNQLGITRVAGDLVIEGRFDMNFLPDPEDATPYGAELGGTLLRVGIDSAAWPPVVTRLHGTLPPGTPKPRVTIAGVVRPAIETVTPASPNQLPKPKPDDASAPTATPAQSGRWRLIRHRSLP
ncbi:MAG TPA: D-alanyl-D-alanine carboxypeptidase, partial [Coleofasciculaceae cyanobacterium]